MTFLNKDLLFISFCTLICIGTIFFAFFVSVQDVVRHWQFAIAPCTECFTTFRQHFFHPSHLLPLSIFLVSSFSLLRGTFYTYKTVKTSHTSHLTKRNLNWAEFVKGSKQAAWCAGVFTPKIYVNETFWSELNDAERLALRSHEEHHIASHDTLLFFLIGLIKSMLPIPFLEKTIEQVSTYYRFKSELRADKQAIKKTSQHTLASVLLKATQFESTHPTQHSIGIDNFAKQRILWITNHPTPPTISSAPRSNINLVLTIFVLAVVASTALFSAEPIQSCLNIPV